jgi:hypothetical protein
MNETRWEERFTKEFGIHFEGIKGELEFAIVFIKEVLAAVRAEVVEECKKAVPDYKEYPFYNGRHNPDSGISGWNACRNELLQALEVVGKREGTNSGV